MQNTFVFVGFFTSLFLSDYDLCFPNLGYLCARARVCVSSPSC